MLLLANIAFSQRDCLSPKPIITFIDTITFQQWLKYENAPVIFIKLKNQKYDWVVNGWEISVLNRCTFWKYYGQELESGKVQVQKYTWTVPCNQIARPR